MVNLGRFYTYLVFPKAESISPVNYWKLLETLGVGFGAADALALTVKHQSIRIYNTESTIL